jgi:hypothetical protein
MTTRRLEAVALTEIVPRTETRNAIRPKRCLVEVTVLADLQVELWMRVMASHFLLLVAGCWLLVAGCWLLVVVFSRASALAPKVRETGRLLGLASDELDIV